ncbi:MAG TPA: hypothetical protein VH092_03260 [Urbifossiella sp.]|nr:hypothetical protein [Urbifossiella sp.]
MKFPLGEMTVGDILDRGLRLLFARLPVFYAINLLVLAPVTLLQIVGPLVAQGVAQGGGQLDPAAVLAGVGLGLFGLLLTLILLPIGSAAILHIIMEEYAGNRIGIGQALSYALTRFLPLLGASIVVGLMVWVGVFLCCIPGIYLYVTYAFISQIVVLERKGLGDALSRCSTLVDGHRWRVFGVLFLVGLASAIVQFAIGAALGFVLPSQEVIPAANGPQVQINPLNHIVDTIIAQLVSILFNTYIAVCGTLLYLDLRIRKEGFDLELAAGGRGDDRDNYDDDDDDRTDRRRRRDRYDDDDYDDDNDDRGRRR